MTDYEKALANARDALAKYQARETRHYIDEALRDLLTAIDAAQPKHSTQDCYEHFLSYSGAEDHPWLKYAYFHGADVGIDRPAQATPAAVPAPEVLVRAYFHRFSEVEDDYTIYHTLDGVCEQCIPVLIVRDAAALAGRVEVGRDK